MIRCDPTLVDLTSNFFVLCRKLKFIKMIIHSGWSLTWIFMKERVKGFTVYKGLHVWSLYCRAMISRENTIKAVTTPTLKGVAMISLAITVDNNIMRVLAMIRTMIIPRIMHNNNRLPHPSPLPPLVQHHNHQFQWRQSQYHLNNKVSIIHGRFYSQSGAKMFGSAARSAQSEL